jgi:hypothetical protein
MEKQGQMLYLRLSSEFSYKAAGCQSEALRGCTVFRPIRTILNVTDRKRTISGPTKYSHMNLTNMFTSYVTDEDHSREASACKVRRNVLNSYDLPISVGLREICR